MEERLQKILARAGFGSRRDCEEYIREGRVRVNGQVAELGSKADASKDHISLDGTTLPQAEPLMYYALYKPRGVISSVGDPQNRQNVRDLIPISGSIYPVGRLDEDSEGLILMTNDGELANRLTHPKYGHEKEYKVLVARQPDENQLEALRHGIILEDGYRTAPAQVVVENPFGKGAWLRIILKEGRKRQIREMGMRIGLPVVRIQRVRIGTLKLGNLKPGEWRPLKPDEVSSLMKPANTSARASTSPTRKADSETAVRRSSSRRAGESSLPRGSKPKPPFGAFRTPRPTPKTRRK